MGSEGVSLVNLEISCIRKDPMKLFIQMCNYAHLYKKAGIIFKHLNPENQIQADLFNYKDFKRSKKLMQTLDNINKKMGSDTLKYAATGLTNNQRWKTLFKRRSPSYTSNWDQLLKVS